MQTIAERAGLNLAKLSPGATRGFEWIIAKYFEAASIEDASVHALRHTSGTHMVKNGSNLRTVQDDGAQGFSDELFMCRWPGT